jgi:hypothetical protein
VWCALPGLSDGGILGADLASGYMLKDWRITTSEEKMSAELLSHLACFDRYWCGGLAGRGDLSGVSKVEHCADLCQWQDRGIGFQSPACRLNLGMAIANILVTGVGGRLESWR